MNRAQKQAAVEDLHQVFKAHSSFFLVDFMGLNVAGEQELRRRIRDVESQYRVVKNSLALRASKDTPVEKLEPFFVGPTGVAMTASNPVGLAKVLTEFFKTHPQVGFKSGLLEQALLSVDDVENLARMPGREELLAQLLGLLQSPLTRLARALKSPLNNLVSVLKQLEEKGK